MTVYVAFNIDISLIRTRIDRDPEGLGYLFHLISLEDFLGFDVSLQNRVVRFSAEFSRLFERITVAAFKGLGETLKNKMVRKPLEFAQLFERISLADFQELDPALQIRIIRFTSDFVLLFKAINLEDFKSLDEATRGRIAQNPENFAQLFGKLSLRAFQELNDALKNLVIDNPLEFSLLLERTSLADFLRLTREERDALLMEVHILTPVAGRALDPLAETFLRINRRSLAAVRPLATVALRVQNTHGDGVHETVAQSVLNLKKRYRNIDTDAAFFEIRTYLEDDSRALRSFERAAAIYDFTEQRSQTTMHELLALVWAGVNDDRCLMPGGSVENKKDIFKAHLIESSNEYGSNIATCTSGTFNKIVSSLDIVHPDVRILHLTPAILSEMVQHMMNEKIQIKTGEEKVRLRAEDSLERIGFLDGFKMEFREKFEGLIKEEILMGILICIDSALDNSLRSDS